jgi:2'-5' RNA ligase
MACSVELRFDPTLTQRVVEIWQTLADLGVSRYMLECAAIPHVSLAVYDDETVVDPGILAELVESLAVDRSPLPVAFSSIGVFPTSENVLFLGLVVSEALLAIHQAYHHVAAAFGPACRPYYRPGCWVPNCTLTMRLPTPDLLRGLAHLAAGWAPLEGILRSLALIQAPPVATLLERELTGRP